MSTSHKISGIFQIILGGTILLAGGAILWHKMQYGSAENLNLNYIRNSFRIIKEMHKVHCEQEKKLDKLVRMQLLHASVSAENWLKFKECTESVSTQCAIYASEQRAIAKNCAAELRQLEAYRKICTDAKHFPLYVSALENSAGALAPLRDGLTAAAELKNFSGIGDTLLRRIGSAFDRILAPVDTLYDALGNARTSLANISTISKEELVPAIDARITLLKEQHRTAQQRALAAAQRADAINRLCAMANLQNNIGSLNAAAQELNSCVQKFSKAPLSPEKEMGYEELAAMVRKLKKEIAGTEKTKAEFRKKSPGRDLRDYDRILSDLKDKLADAEKRLSRKEFLYGMEHVLSESSQRLAQVADLKMSMTFLMVCELLFCFCAGAGFIANGTALCRKNSGTV
jgi:hypothetical protein